MTTAPRSTAAFDELISLLQEIRDGYVLDERRFTHDLDVLEAYRYVFQLLSAMSELYVEHDTDHPRFAPIVSPARKLQGDNPDAIYHFARIDPTRRYRVWGVRDKECYTSFTVHGPAADGGMAGPILADVNHHAFEIADDGSYEIVFGAEKEPGNWVQLDPAAHVIIVRSYFQLQRSAQDDPSVHVTIGIECLDDVGPAAPLDDVALESRLREGLAFLRQTTLGQAIPGQSAPVPFLSEQPNTVGKPWCFRDAGLDVPGAVDIYYSMGRWDLGPDDALVMTGTLPAGEFTNVMLWNVHMQTLEYRSRTSSLNAAQIVPEADGSYRIVVARRDPGVPNWLDTGGHPKGTIFWRFLLPEAPPPQPSCEVVPVASLSSRSSDS